MDVVKLVNLLLQSGDWVVRLTENTAKPNLPAELKLGLSFAINLKGLETSKDINGITPATSHILFI